MRRDIAVYAGVTAGMAVVAMLGPPYVRYVVERIAIAGLFAVGFNLVFGLAGIASLGNAAFYGAGAYVAGILAAQHGAPWYAVLPAAIAAGSLLGTIVGVLTARTRGIYALLLTLVLAQSLWGLASQNVALTQGDTGITGITTAFPFAPNDARFGAAVVLVAACAAGLVWLVWTSTYGLIIAAAGTNEIRARALGLSIVRPRITAFALSGAICALAGLLTAQFRGSVSPSDADWQASATVLIAALLGGSQTAFGPALGALLLVTFEMTVGDLTGRWHLALGTVMAGVAIVLPQGLLRPRVRRMPAATPSAGVRRPQSSGDPIFVLTGLSYAIGARVLFSNFSLTLARGERHAVVGPNGVGKSTLFALIGGDRLPDRGTIVFAGRDVTRQRTAARARAGIGRTYQFGALFLTRTVWENIAIAHAAGKRASRSIFRPLARDRILLEDVARSLVRFDLTAFADARVDELAHGTRRVIELAVAFATQPSLVLLDEPTAGLERSEIAQVLAAIEALPRDVALLVIEHDADVAARLCTTVTRLP